MKKINLVLVSLLLSCSCFAQLNDFYNYRRFIDRPSFGGEKMQKLLDDSALRFHYGQSRSLPAATYTALSLREKFAYNMTHAESFAQNCSMDPMVPGEEKQLFAELPKPFGEYHWSDRQYDFFKTNRDSCIAFIKECAGRADHLGVNDKHAIVMLDATALIPFLISTYRMHAKDHDILTVLMLLMRYGKYAPFMQSSIFHRLYESKTSSYYAYVEFTYADKDLIIRDAADFYHGLFK